MPLTQGKGYLVDYNSANNTFSNWTSFDYPNGPAGINFITHFESISSTEPGVYSLCADSVQTGSANPAQGSWVSVRRKSDGTFDKGTWVDLNYPNSARAASPAAIRSMVTRSSGWWLEQTTFPFQATVNIGFQLSNVISGNSGNGINISGSNGNVIAMNYIGTDPSGSTAWLWQPR